MFGATLIEQMKDLSFYKEFYFFEIRRKDEIEKKINLPVLIISVVISIHVYIFSNDLHIDFKLVACLISSLNLIGILITIGFLAKSYSNLFSSYWYKELPIMNDFLKYENELEEEGNHKRIEIRNQHLIKELADCASNNFNLNKERTEAIAKAKQILFIIILLTTFLSVGYIVTLL